MRSSLKKSLRFFLALAIALPTLMGFIMPISSLSATTNINSKLSIQKQKNNISLDATMDCHQNAQDNSNITNQNCFLHCFTQSHQPTILSTQASLVKDQGTASIGSLPSFLQYLTLNDFASLLATGPPPSQVTLLPYSTIAALLENNNRLRI